MDDPIVLRPGEGEQLGNGIVKSARPELSLIEFELAPGGEVAPHLHRGHSDSFYVLEGEVEFFFGGEWKPAGPGSYVSIPRNVEHGFRPAGTAIRLLNFHTPRVGFVDSLRG